MNAYYHEFAVGFNWWMVIGAMMVVSMVLLGVYRYYLNSEVRVIRRFEDKLISIIAAFEAAIFGFLLFVESRDGIIQYFDNGLTEFDSPIWSIILMPFVIIFAAIFFFVILFGVCKIASWARKGYIYEKKKEVLRNRRNERIDHYMNSTGVHNFNFS
ncbi:hypothetical protein J6V85_03770 [Candidatus Saccharibacteria bacterium]|nr:hypothetical protein [Candidatus Saccharibacteria bacterium]